MKDWHFVTNNTAFETKIIITFVGFTVFDNCNGRFFSPKP
jgi:hypothetical protein